MTRFDSVTLHLLIGFQINSMKIQSMRTWQKTVHNIKVSPQFLRVTRLARIVPGGRDAACQLTTRIFKPAHIVALPAVETHRYLLEACNGLFCIHSELCIALFRQGICILNLRL